MKERSIRMTAPEVRAILAGTKTQTRRVVKLRYGADVVVTNGQVWKPARVDYAGYVDCPYGQVGDLLWVRKAFSGPHCMDASDGCKAVPPSKWGDCSRIWYWADGNMTEGDWTRQRPSIHMPRWASRITLEITDVRVERLQEISEADAKAEGVSMPDGTPTPPDFWSYQQEFRHLWEQINGPGSWNANPWVWAISFRRIEP